MSVVSMTGKWLEALAGTGKRVDYVDVRTSGLSLRVSADGETQAWSYSYRTTSGKRARVALGRAPAVTLGAARAAALAHAASIAKGGDPAAERRAPSGATLSDLVDTWTVRRGPEIRSAPLTLVRMRAHVLPKFGKLPIAELRRADIALHLEKLARADVNTGRTRRGGPAGANRTRDDLLAILNWGVGAGLLDDNPLSGLKRPAATRSRERVLDDAELRAMLKALPVAAMEDATRRVVTLLLLTGCRVGEVVGTTLADIDLTAATLFVPAERSKNGRATTVPLTAPALDLVRAQIADNEAAEARRAKRERRDPAPVEYLFASARTGAPMEPHAISVAVRRNLKILGAGQFTPHDLRRTAATVMADCGVQPHIIEVALHHISGFRAGVAGIYNRSSYAREHRDALERLAARIAEIEAGSERKVVPLKWGAV